MELALRAKKFISGLARHTSPCVAGQGALRGAENQASAGWSDPGPGRLGQAGLLALRADAGEMPKVSSQLGQTARKGAPKPHTRGWEATAGPRAGISKGIFSGQGREMEGLGLSGRGNGRAKKKDAGRLGEVSDAWGRILLLAGSVW